MLEERDDGLATANDGSRPVPIGSRFIAVSLQPAIPRRVLPSRARFRFTGHRHSSSIPTRRGNPNALLNSPEEMQPKSRSSCPSGTRVSSLLCTPGDISILRRYDRQRPVGSRIRRGSVSDVYPEGALSEMTCLPGRFACSSTAHPLSEPRQNRLDRHDPRRRRVLPTQYNPIDQPQPKCASQARQGATNGGFRCRAGGLAVSVSRSSRTPIAGSASWVGFDL